MVDSIKITALQNIGANIAYTSLIPVVNMAGEPETQKANLQILGNLILNGAGGSYFARAAQANLALSVANAAQPNITSVGTLTSLVVSGNANITGNLNIAVGSLRIPGGTNGYVLQTDGAGHLTWTAQTGNGGGNGTPGGSNTQVQFNDAGSFGGNSAFTFDKTISTLSTGNVDLTGNINANWVIGDYVSGNAHNLFYIPGANVNGQVGYANVANHVAVANVTGLGNIATVNLTGSSSNVLYGNGVFAAPTSTYSNSNVANYLPTYTGNIGANVITNSANLTIQTDTGNANVRWVFGAGGALYWPTVPGGEWAIEPNNDDEFEIHSHTNVVISTDTTNSNYHFTFDTSGSLSFPTNNLYINGDTSVFGSNTAVIQTGPNVPLALITDGANSSLDAIWLSNVADPANAEVAAMYFNPTASHGNIRIITGNNATGTNTWTFDQTGNLTLPGNTFAVKYANGTSVPLGGGNVSQLTNGDESFVLDSDGNVVFDGPGPGGVDRGLVWDYGANANGVNSMIRQDLNGLTVRAWTENGGNYNAPVNIITGQDANTNTWTFDGQGNLTVPSGSINSIDSVGDLGAYVTLNPDLGLAKLAGRNALSNVGYTNTSWSTATYTGTQIDFTNAPDLVTFFTDNQFNVGVNQTLSINGDEPVPFTGYSTGSSNAVTVYTSATASPDPTTVTSIDFYYQLESYVAVVYDAGQMNMIATGMSIYIDNDQTQGPDIFIRSGDDITLQAKDKSLGSESEGGDININGGDGASDDGNGNVSSSGGDIIIVGGIGGHGNSGTGSSGGFSRLQGGDGGDAGVGTTAGAGGYVQINAGAGGYNGGNAQLGSQGGYVEIYAGQTTLADGVGGYVTISSGTAGDGNGIAGNVQITTPVSATANGGNWIFDGRGNLTLPDGNPHIKTLDETDTVTISVSGTANQRSEFSIGSDGGTDQFMYMYSRNDVTGTASFGLNAPNGVPTSAVISVNNGAGALDWTFSSAALDATEAYLYTPAGATITTPNAGSGQTGKNIFIEAGSVDQENYNTNTGGELMLKGGRGGFNDGGGGGPGGNVNINAGESADPAGHAGNVNITAGALTNWTFDYTGNLTLPANTFSVNYANGTPVTFGAAALGNVTFDNVTVQGVNGLNLSAGSDFTANLAYLQVRGGDVASHIHLDTGNNIAYDQYFGNDNKYLKLGLGIAGNVSIGTYQDGGVGQLEWIFDSNGNLVLAGGNSLIQSFANSSLDPLNPNVSTMVFTPDQGYSSQALVLDPTAPGHIHLRAPGGGIDQPSANIFLGGEDSSFEVGYYTGTAPNVFIHSNDYTWTFDNSGALSFPRDVVGNTDPYLVINGGTTPAINSVDASLAGPANLQISTNYLNLSGYTGATIDIHADTGEIAGSSDIVLTTNNANVGNTFSWTFDDVGNLSAPGNINFINGSNALLAYGANNYINMNNDGGMDLSCNTEVKITTNYGDAPNRAYSYFYANGTFSAAGNITTTGNITATNIGNVAALNLDGSSSNVLYGNGVFAAPTSGSGSNISNGNSNVNIATANGNVTIAAVGNSVVTITGTGANITGTANISGNANVGNLGVAAVVATANISTTGYFISGNQATGGFQLGNSNSRLKSGDSNSYMTMGQNPSIFPDTAASGSAGVLIGGSGYILGNNGSRCITLNYGGSGGVVGLNSNVQVGTAGSGTVLVPGTVTTGVNSILAGPTFTPLANTMAGFVSNVNSYTQLTIQNKNTGADATVDFVATADNGSDTVNYLDMGIINSGYDNNTPTNSLGNIVFAADSYMYAQGNTSNASQSGGNLAIGTTVPGKNVKIFAGGVDNTAIVANIANTGISITGNLGVSGNITGNTNGFAIGYLNIPQVSASNTTLGLSDAGKHYYSTTAGNLTLTIPLNSTTAFPTGTAISIVVQAAGNVLVNAASGVSLYMAGNSTSANRVVGTYGMATLMKVATDTWFINGTGVS